MYNHLLHSNELGYKLLLLQYNHYYCYIYLKEVYKYQYFRYILPNNYSQLFYSFGLNINLPFEAVANPFISGDPKLIGFDYFFTRKFSFIKEGDAVVAFPGGFGTMDEIFETLTLIQTGKVSIYPLVLIDAKGGHIGSFGSNLSKNILLALTLFPIAIFLCIR